jgi:hypothetical protein
MTQNPSSLRPDLARSFIPDTRRLGQPTIGMVSLGCPKALVDSERILTRLRAEGYAISPDYKGADAVIVNTCGFLDSAKAESLDAIGEALARIPRFWPSPARINMRRFWTRSTAPCRPNPTPLSIFCPPRRSA